MYVQAALAGAKPSTRCTTARIRRMPFSMSTSTSDDQWFLIVVSEQKTGRVSQQQLAARNFWLDARFNGRCEARRENAAALTEILDKVFASQTLDHWRHAFRPGSHPPTAS